jgi:hypothetical protein
MKYMFQVVYVESSRSRMAKTWWQMVVMESGSAAKALGTPAKEEPDLTWGGEGGRKHGDRF